MRGDLKELNLLYKQYMASLSAYLGFLVPYFLHDSLFIHYLHGSQPTIHKVIPASPVVYLTHMVLTVNGEGEGGVKIKVWVEKNKQSSSPDWF